MRRKEINMTSEIMRDNPLFMRNGYDVAGRWEIPVVRKQMVDFENIKLIPCSETRPNDREDKKNCGVHFFVDDYRFNAIYNNPEKSLAKFSQYRFLLTPDFSTYADMNYWRQLESVAHSRWVGAYWQSKGLIVIPTVTWSTPLSYSFCFDGIEKGAIVAIGLPGCKREKTAYLRGYAHLLERIEPSVVLCLGKPFKEMDGNIIVADYYYKGKAVC